MYSRIFILSLIAIGSLEAQTNQYKMALLQQKIEQLSERVEGLTTIVEGLNASIGEIKESQKGSQNKNLATAEAKIESLSKECITHDEIESILSSYSKNDTQSNDSKQISKKQESKNESKPLDKKSNALLYREGAQLFQKHQYNKAHKRFTLMIEKNYKPASSNYYLGEIAYYTKKYGDAIFYFKKSAGLYDKASYIDTLLLHTAISLEKEGDISQAKLFYQTIIDDYSKKKSAIIAKNNLKKL